MTTNATTGEASYPSCAGLDRVANIRGIPLMPGLVVFCSSLFVGLFGSMALGPAGLLLALAGIPVLLFFRFLCETDDQALHIAWLEIRCGFDRRNDNLFGQTYTLSPVRYGPWRQAEYRRHFVRHTRAWYDGGPVTEDN